jgi:hypothetical protein
MSAARRSHESGFGELLAADVAEVDLVTQHAAKDLIRV